ncbi:unnamed protein product, partial [Ectocarpus sp. 12 AP-2014]
PDSLHTNATIVLSTAPYAFSSPSKHADSARLFAAMGLPPSGHIRAWVPFAFLLSTVFPRVMPPCLARHVRNSCVFLFLWSVGHHPRHPSPSLPLLVPFAVTHSLQQRTYSWQ